MHGRHLNKLNDNVESQDSPLLIPTKSPFEFFAVWMDEAANCGMIEPFAMTIATTGVNNRPSARQVLLKEYGEAGFVFYTNFNSRKAEELTDNPFASAVMWWDRLYRQVRIEGQVQKVTDDISDEYFATRPRGSQISASVSPQSEVIDSFESLKSDVAQLESKLQGKPVPRPPHWGGYRLMPDYFEFWQGRKDRLHQRLCYRVHEGKWLHAWLGP